MMVTITRKDGQHLKFKNVAFVEFTVHSLTLLDENCRHMYWIAESYLKHFEVSK